MPVIIEAGKTTSVHIDGSEPPGNSRGAGSRFVSLRGGLVRMKDIPDIAESLPVKAGAGSVAAADDVELTPKEEAEAANHLPPDEHLAKSEEKLEHDAAVANRVEEQNAEMMKR